MTQPALVNVPSQFDPAATASRIEAEIKKRGMAVFARIDHAAAAKSVGLELRPTEVMLFGNPKVGTLLMQDVQTIGIDLPLKFLVWEDERKQTGISYDDTSSMAERHGATDRSAQTVSAMQAMLANLADAASREFLGV